MKSCMVETSTSVDLSSKWIWG